MGFKDDFLEALRSVKRDILGQSPVPEAEKAAGYRDDSPHMESGFLFSSDTGHGQEGQDAFPNEAVTRSAQPEPEQPARDIHNNSNQQAAFESVQVPPAPFPHIPADDAYASGDARQIFDFDSSDMYSDDKTVISRNTVIRGSLQTQDSIRMLGQVLGDIECRSNVVIAGKMRGNTAASNAYVVGAQVDGDMVCEDSINVNDSAWILGNIRAQQAEIDGKIKGNLEIRHSVSIGPSSSIIGNISADELEIKRGAFVNGQIIMYSPSRDVIDRFDHFGGAQQ